MAKLEAATPGDSTYGLKGIFLRCWVSSLSPYLCVYYAKLFMKSGDGGGGAILQTSTWTHYS